MLPLFISWLPLIFVDQSSLLIIHFCKTSRVYRWETKRQHNHMLYCRYVNWQMFNDQSARLWKKWCSWLRILMHVFYLHNDLWNKELAAKFMQQFTVNTVVTEISTVLLGDWCYLTKVWKVIIMHVGMVQRTTCILLYKSVNSWPDKSNKWCPLRKTPFCFIPYASLEVSSSQHQALRWVFLAGIRTK